MNKLFNLLGNDGCKHIILSAILTVGLNLFLQWWVAALITIAIGIGKEIYDKVSGKGCAEWKDMACDIVGIIIGIM